MKNIKLKKILNCCQMRIKNEIQGLSCDILILVQCVQAHPQTEGQVLNKIDRIHGMLLLLPWPKSHLLLSSTFCAFYTLLDRASVCSKLFLAVLEVR